MLIDAPYIITDDMISSLHIHAVVRGTCQPADEQEQKPSPLSAAAAAADGKVGAGDPYRLPREMGILQVVPSSNELTAFEVVDRVLSQKETYKKK